MAAALALAAAGLNAQTPPLPPLAGEIAASPGDYLAQRLFQELLLDKLDRHFGEEYFALMDPTVALLPGELKPVTDQTFGVVPEPKGALLAALLAMDLPALQAYADWISSRGPAAVQQWANQLDNYLLDTLYELSAMGWNQSGYPAELKAFVLRQTFGPISHRLLLHLKADALTGLSPGDSVTEWPDASGQGNHASAPAPFAPTYRQVARDGKMMPAVRFDGALRQYLDARLPATPRNAVTAFVMFQSELPDGTDTLLSPVKDPVDAWAPLLYLQDNADWGGIRFFGQSHNRFFASSAFYAPGTWSLESIRYDSDSGVIALSRNGEPDGGGDLIPRVVYGYAAPVGVHDVPAMGIWRIGNNLRLDLGLTGEITELLVFEGSLPPRERDQVESYLSAKYGLNIPQKQTLFSDHFNAPDSPDENAGQAERQSGLLAPVAYQVNQPNESWILGNALVLTNTQHFDRWSLPLASPRMDFRTLEVNDSFRIRCRITPPKGPSPTGNVLHTAIALANSLGAGLPYLDLPYLFEGSWGGIKFRNQRPLEFATTGDGMGVLLFPAGVVLVMDGDRTVYAGYIVSAETFEVDIWVEENQLRLWINGMQPTNADPSLYPEFPLPVSGRAGNYLSLGAGAGIHKLSPRVLFDDLDVTVLPDPDPPQRFTILSDHFEGSGPGLNEGLESRQSGAWSPVRYETVSSAPGAAARIEAGRLVLAIPPSSAAQVSASLAQNFKPAEAAESFRLECRITLPAGSGGRYAGFTLRGSQPLGGAEDGFQLRILDNGQLAVSDAGFPVPVRSVPVAAAYQVVCEIRNHRLQCYINGRPVVFQEERPSHLLASQLRNYVQFFAGGLPGNPGGEATFDALTLEAWAPIPPLPIAPRLSISRLNDQQVMVSWPRTPTLPQIWSRTALEEPWSPYIQEIQSDLEAGVAFFIEDLADHTRFYQLRLEE